MHAGTARLQLNQLPRKRTAGQTATWTGGSNSNILVSDDTVFNNLGTFVASGVGSYNESAAGDNSSFNNMGTWTASGLDSFTVPFNMVGGSLAVTGDGSVELANGTSTGGAVQHRVRIEPRIGQRVFRILRRPDHNLQRDRGPALGWVHHTGLARKLELRWFNVRRLRRAQG